MPKTTRLSTKSIPVLLDVAPKTDEWEGEIWDLEKLLFGTGVEAEKHEHAQTVARTRELTSQLARSGDNSTWDNPIWTRRWFDEETGALLRDSDGKDIAHYGNLIIEAIQMHGFLAISADPHLPEEGEKYLLGHDAYRRTFEMRDEIGALLTQLRETSEQRAQPIRLAAAKELQRILLSFVPEQRGLGKADAIVTALRQIAPRYCGQLLLWRQVKPAIKRFCDRGLSQRQALDRVIEFYELNKDAVLNFLNFRDDLTPRGKAHMSVEQQAAASIAQELGVSLQRIRNMLSDYRRLSAPKGSP